MSAGRPTKYNAELNEQVEKLCKLGATDKQLADFFGIAESTLNLWKTKEPQFMESIKRGKLIADAEVANSLYKRALGYEHPEDKIFNDSGEPLVVPTTKHYPPDSTACLFWLKNRAGWRDKSEQEVSGPNGGPIESKWTVEFINPTKENDATFES